MKKILFVSSLALSINSGAVTLDDIVGSIKPLPSVTGNDTSNATAAEAKAKAFALAKAREDEKQAKSSKIASESKSKTASKGSSISSYGGSKSAGSGSAGSGSAGSGSAGSGSDGSGSAGSGSDGYDAGYTPTQSPEIPSYSSSYGRVISYLTGSAGAVDSITSRIINFTLEKNPTVAYGCWSSTHNTDGVDIVDTCGNITTSYTSHYVIAGGPRYNTTGELLYNTYQPSSDRDMLIAIMSLIPPSNEWTDQMRGWAADGLCIVGVFCSSPPDAAMATLQYQKEIGGIELEVIPSPPVMRQVITLSGSPVMPFAVDGDTLQTKFGRAKGLTFFDRSTLYFADGCSIRKIIPSDKITPKSSGSAQTITSMVEHDLNLTTYTMVGSIASCNGLDGPASMARFSAALSGMAKHGFDMVVSDGGAIRKVTTSGTVTTLAGMVDQTDYIDGPSKTARFSTIGGVTSDGKTVYISDTLNNAIRILKPDGTVGTLAGNALNAGYVDGAQADVRFDNPSHIVNNGKILIVWDSNNKTLRKVDVVTGATTSLAGRPGTTSILDGIGDKAELFNVTALHLFGDTLFIADEGYIRRMNITKGDVLTIAGNGSGKKKDGIGTSAGFMEITSMLCDGYDLYLFDNSSFRVLKDALK